MVACATGAVQIVKFLLESAVYPPVRDDEDSDSDSDADSGVLAPTGGHVRRPVGKNTDGKLLKCSECECVCVWVCVSLCMIV